MKSKLIFLLISITLIGFANCDQNHESNEIEASQLWAPSTIEPLSPKMTEFINSINTTWRVRKLIS